MEVLAGLMKSKIDNRKSEMNLIWQFLVKSAAGWRCEMCGSATNGLHAAHIIGRRALWTCWRVRNGLALCVSCHDDVKIAVWLKTRNWDRRSPYRYRWRWIVAQKRKINPVFRESDLRNVERRLRRKYRTAA